MIWIKNIIVAMLLVSLSGSLSLYGADTENDYNAIKSRVLNVQAVNSSLPTTLPVNDRKGSIGFIISKLFDNDGKIGNWFLKALGTRSDGAVLRWSGGNGGQFVQGSIYDDGTNVGIGGSPTLAKLDIFGFINTQLSYVLSDSVSGDSVAQIREIGSNNQGLRFTNGANNFEWMRINSSGNVGIGINPSYKLDVSGDINFTGDLYQGGTMVDFAGKFKDGTNPLHAVYTDGNVGVGTVTPLYKFHVDTTGNSNALIVNNATGRVGIGTATLGSALNIGGDRVIRFDNTSGTLSNSNSSSYISLSTNTINLKAQNIRVNGFDAGAGFNIQAATAGNIPIIIRGAVSQTADLLKIQDSSGGSLLALDKDGNFAVTSSNGSSVNDVMQLYHNTTASWGAGAGAGILFQTDNTSNSKRELGSINMVSTDAAGYHTADFTVNLNNNGINSAEVLRVKANGNVGIGTINPGYLLDVTGTVNATAFRGNGADLTDINGDNITDNTVDSSEIEDGSIMNADINASAAIAGTKISPDFGNQNVVTTGDLDIGGFAAIGLKTGSPTTNTVLKIGDNDFDGDTNRNIYQTYINQTIPATTLTGNRTSYGHYINLVNNKGGSTTSGERSYAVGVQSTVRNNGSNYAYDNKGGTFEARNESTAGAKNIMGLQAQGRQNDTTGSSTVGTIYGIQSIARGDGNAAGDSKITTARGITSSALAYETDIVTADGLYAIAQTNNGDTGTITTAYGVRGYVNSDSDDGGSITNGRAGYFHSYGRDTAPLMISSIGVYGEANDGVTAYGGQFIADDTRATTNYGVYANATNASGNNWSIYSVGGKNYFEGNVGIGITNPENRLHVAGNILLGNNNEVRFKDSGGVQRTALRLATDNDLEIWNSAGNVLFQGGGNVGMGTTSPDEKLHVSNGWVLVDNGFGYRAKGGSGTVANMMRTGVADQMVVGSGLWSSISFHTGLADRMYIDGTTGNVGIGTANPESKLHVAGTIKAGNISATNGSTIIEGIYSGANVLNILGSQYSSAATVLSHAIRPKQGAVGYVSSAGNAASTKGSIEITNQFVFQNAPSAIVAIGADVTMTERFKVAANGDTTIGGSLIISGGLDGDSIIDGTIDSSEIENNTLTATDIATDAIGSAEIQAQAVGTSEILNNTITEADISDAFVARDSNLLDGIDSASFIRSDANDNVTGHTEWQDSKEVRLGAGADLRLAHDGTNSFIRNYTGNFTLRSYSHGSTVSIQGEDAAGSNKNLIVADPDNAVSLYYVGNKKLATTNTGINVTGTVVAGEPTASNHLTTKNYVDTLVTAGVTWKAPVTVSAVTTYGACDASKEGWTTYNKSDDIVYICDAVAWISIGSSASIPYATTSTAGKMQIAGDIQGTWNNITIKTGVIDSANIVDSTITSADILNSTITSADILNNTLTASDIGPNSINASELSDNSVASANIIDSTITSADILNNTIVEADISDAFVARNSQLLDGFNSSQGSTVSTVAVRNTSGDITARLFRSEYATQTSLTAASDIAFRVNNTTDNYIRYVDRTGMLAYLGKVNDANLLDGINSSAFIRSNAADDVTANTEWQDSKEVRLGAGADMRLFHNGTNSYIRNYTGNLEIRSFSHGSPVYIQGEDAAGTNRNMIHADPDNAVQLYYNGASKIATTSAGINVTGTAIASRIGVGITPSGNLSSGSAIAIGDGDTGLKQMGDGKLAIYTNNAERMRVIANGNVGIGATVPKDKLDVNGNIRLRSGTLIFGNQTGNNKQSIYGDDNSAFYFDSSNDTQSQIIFRDDDNLNLGGIYTNESYISLRTGSSEHGFLSYKNGASQMYHNNTWRLRTHTSGIQLNGGTQIDNVTCIGNCF